MRKWAMMSLGLLWMSTAAFADDSTEISKKVWDHHIATWQSRDLDGLLSDYNDDSAVIIVNKVYKGKPQIRKAFEFLFQTFDRATAQTIDPTTIEGQIVYITWNAEIDGIKHPVGTDTFVIENGKIFYQTITSDLLLFGNLPN